MSIDTQTRERLLQAGVTPTGKSIITHYEGEQAIYGFAITTDDLDDYIRERGWTWHAYGHWRWVDVNWGGGGRTSKPWPTGTPLLPALAAAVLAAVDATRPASAAEPDDPPYTDEQNVQAPQMVVPAAEPDAPAWTPQVGDRVRVNPDAYGTASAGKTMRGMHGKIIQTDSERPDSYAVEGFDKTWWWFRADELTHLEPVPAEQPAPQFQPGEPVLYKGKVWLYAGAGYVNRGVGKRSRAVPLADLTRYDPKEWTK